MQEDGPQNENSGEDNGSTTHCHCQGGRLLVLFGPIGYELGPRGRPVRDGVTGNHRPEDLAMFNAQNWALGFYQSQRNAGKHIHMLSYNAPPKGSPNDVHRPGLPVPGATPKETISPKNGNDQNMPAWNWKWEPSPRVGKIENTLPKCCCFLTEVLLICHGGQGADVSFITETLANVIGGRPAEKFVFWSCRSGKLFMPGDQSYKEICGVFRPRMCECGCTAGACTAFDPDGKQRHCPEGTESTTIVTSGQFGGKPTPVGLSPSTDPSAANPFTTPDGQVRTITIAPDANPPAKDQATATIGPHGNPPPSVPIFGGEGTSTEPPVPAPPPNTTEAAKLVAKMEKASPVKKRKIPYSCPVANLSQCQPSEGCLPGGSASQPQ